jgi:hypothetical protein
MYLFRCFPDEIELMIDDRRSLTNIRGKRVHNYRVIRLSTNSTDHDDCPQENGHVSVVQAIVRPMMIFYEDEE